MRKKVFSINTELYKLSGVQRVLMDIHRAICNEYCAKIVGTVDFSKVHKDIGIDGKEYIRFMNPFMFYDSIVIVHERKLLILFWLLNCLLFQRIKIIYVHHNVFYTYRRLSVMPHTVVAISNEGINNLHTFFNVPLWNIHKIYNCVIDTKPQYNKIYEGQNIKILYPARINDTKRQIEIVRRLSGKLSSNIEILFAGTGPYAADLEREIEHDLNFKYLGYRSDIHNLMAECNYVMLFSKHEGLPISLIEATMMGCPIICNNVGGNPEIVCDGKNGMIIDKNDWDTLILVLNNLPNISLEEYNSMSKYSREIYENNFTYEVFKKKYLNLLQTLA